jgi:hypothetical protein
VIPPYVSGDFLHHNIPVPYWYGRYYRLHIPGNDELKKVEETDCGVL